MESDVSIAKNYLNGVELEDMGKLVNSVLDMAERMADRHIPMTMEDWAKRIDIILEAGGDAILNVSIRGSTCVDKVWLQLASV